jgi:hypothetical protein
MNEKNFYYSTNLALRMSSKETCTQPDFLLFEFLDFLDNNLVEENIVIADKEQLMRIASLVDGVDVE